MLNDILHPIEQLLEDFVEEHYYEIDGFIDEYILELFVWIPWLENRIRSHRLTKGDIEAMSKKGYNIFDGDKGRFVKEIPPAAVPRFK